MKILILGGNGMLGHHFLNAWQESHDVKVTLRDGLDKYTKFQLFNNENSYFDVDVCSLNRVETVIADFSPDAIVNAIGITKQLTQKKSPELSIRVNALFPHLLAELCKKNKIRLIHLSTDCIFSGKKGAYSEFDDSDAEDLYGKTKCLGEINQKHVVTLRKSTVGLELSGTHGLIEWFLSQTGTINGYRKAIYTGLITTELAKVIELLLVQHPTLSGIWNVASKPINKYELLEKLSQRLGRRDINILPDDNFICDRSLVGNRFEEETGYRAPEWDDMLDLLVNEIRARE